MTLQRVESCNDIPNLPVIVNGMKMFQPARNKYVISGQLIITKPINGSLELQMVITRCRPDRTECGAFDKVVFKNICDKIFDKKAFWSELTKKMVPHLECPLKPGTFNFNNGTIDLSMFTKLPLSGYLWIIRLTIVKVDDEKKKNTLLFCSNADMMITSSKKRTKKNQ